MWVTRKAQKILEAHDHADWDRNIELFTDFMKAGMRFYCHLVPSIGLKYIKLAQILVGK